MAAADSIAAVLMHAFNGNQLFAAPTPTAATRTLYIPELLHPIFSFLSRKCNVSNACVCKVWSEIALDVIWSEVDGLVPLFTALKPIVTSRIDHAFVAAPDVTDWIRFQKYAHRVRSLCFSQEDDDRNPFKILDDVAWTRISLEIFPNLHTLEWINTSTEDLKYCRLFLHSGIKHLTMSFHGQGMLLADICARSPNLHTLTLHIPIRGIDMTSHAQVIAQNLQHLRKLILPEFHYTSTVIQELSHMKNLNDIDFNYDGDENSTNVDSFNPVLTEGSFPALLELGLTAGIDDMERFFQGKFAPVKLTTLYLDSYKKHTPSEVHSLLLALSQKCQLLSQLYIRLLNEEFSLSEIPSDEQISFDTLQSLFSFPHLTWFELIHKYPLRITLGEVEELASRWPSVESLELNSQPLCAREFPLDLRALLPFAKHCHKLEYLGVFIGATGFEVPHTSSIIQPFRALQTLNVGTSRLRNPIGVATFLSLLFPPGCTLQCGATWWNYDTNEHHQLETEVSDQVAPWENMTTLLPFLDEVRRDGRKRMDTLQEEVEELRTQNRLLMDKAGIRAEDL